MSARLFGVAVALAPVISAALLGLSQARHALTHTIRRHTRATTKETH